MILDYKQIDPELLAPLENFPPFGIARDKMDDIRAMVAAMPQPPKPKGLLEARSTIETKNGSVDVYVYRKSTRPYQPAVLWIHGGGYVMGAPDDIRAMGIAMEFDCTLFSVDYRVAPEHPFPAAPEDCYAALTWLMSGDSGYDIDTSRVVLAGPSGGGGLAAGVALMNRDRADFPLRLQLLIYPMLDNLHGTISGEYENHPVWNRGDSDNAWEMYLDGTPGQAASPYASATRAENLAGLPPTYICVGAVDLFRDECIEYGTRLMAAEIPTELAVFPGVYHGAESLAPDAAVSQRMNNSLMQALGDALT
ncbi:MAG: alpha/beta hydrolase [Gammaproteobacteria bacterium]|nr:alpha/beta hydrolase [Gammaproteobacteria bacterium]MYG12718.1 alpha/beta hydrolase [Gammaproteobacteria bacterium]MYK28870.1 alpha/beta hydrolase [Gammaproteobacteria bacterium]